MQISGYMYWSLSKVSQSDKSSVHIMVVAAGAGWCSGRAVGVICSCGSIHLSSQET